MLSLIHNIEGMSPCLIGFVEDFCEIIIGCCCLSLLVLIRVQSVIHSPLNIAEVLSNILISKHLLMILFNCLFATWFKCAQCFLDLTFNLVDGILSELFLTGFSKHFK